MTGSDGEAIGTDRVREAALRRLEESLGHGFASSELLTAALTHRSHTAENPSGSHYERLEFLGDAVLQLAATRYLYDNYPDATEGEMAKVRASVVSEAALAMLARRIHVAEAMLLGKGEEQTGGRDKDSILSDVVESLLAAMYLEVGFDRAAAVVYEHWGPLIDERAAAPGRRDYKTRLQEHLARQGRLPVYEASEEGPQHAKTFIAQVSVDGRVIGAGSGTSKKRAEQAAAQEGLTAVTDP